VNTKIDFDLEQFDKPPTCLYCKDMPRTNIQVGDTVLIRNKVTGWQFGEVISLLTDGHMKIRANDSDNNFDISLENVAALALN
jgi:hypothetical protein